MVRLKGAGQGGGLQHAEARKMAILSQETVGHTFDKAKRRALTSTAAKRWTNAPSTSAGNFHLTKKLYEPKE
jgi:hypothetical protein